MLILEIRGLLHDQFSGVNKFLSNATQTIDNEINNGLNFNDDNSIKLGPFACNSDIYSSNCLLTVNVLNFDDLSSVDAGKKDNGQSQVNQNNDINPIKQAILENSTC